MSIYPCQRCEGKGEIPAFGHVLGGVCFKCKGSGKQYYKPSQSVQWVVWLPVVGETQVTNSHFPWLGYGVKAPNSQKALIAAAKQYAKSCARGAYCAGHYTTEGALVMPADVSREWYQSQQNFIAPRP